MAKEIEKGGITYKSYKNAGVLTDQWPFILNNQEGPDSADGGIINAVDIDWNGAQVGNSEINTTSDLLTLVNSKVNASDIPEIPDVSEFVTTSTLNTALADKQDKLTNGANIATINGQSLTYGGNITINASDGGLKNYGAKYYYKTNNSCSSTSNGSPSSNGLTILGIVGMIASNASYAPLAYMETIYVYAGNTYRNNLKIELLRDFYEGKTFKVSGCYTYNTSQSEFMINPYSITTYNEYLITIDNNGTITGYKKLNAEYSYDSNSSTLNITQ